MFPTIDTDIPYRNLIAQIFLRALSDLRRKDSYRHRAREFLESEWAEDLAEWIDLDIEEVRLKIE
jgi:hypothetical protein